MADLKTLLELLQSTPPLLLLVVGLTLFIGKGAFFSWNEGLIRFQNRRILRTHELLKTLGDATKGDLQRALKDEIEAAVFQRYVGIEIDGQRRRAIKDAFAEVGAPVEFPLLRRAWSYLDFSPPELRVKPLDGFRRWLFWLANGTYLVCTLLFAILFVGALSYGDRNRLAAAAFGLGAFGVFLIGAMLLPAIWNFRAAERLKRLLTPVPDDEPGRPAV